MKILLRVIFSVLAVIALIIAVVDKVTNNADPSIISFTCWIVSAVIWCWID